MKSKKMEVYDWFDIQNEICKEMGIKEYQFRDLNNSNQHFQIWCNAKGYGAKDPDGKDCGSSQIWFKEYTESPDGEAIRPPYCDLWQLTLEKVLFNNVYNGLIRKVYPLEDYDDEDEAAYYHEGIEWKKSFFDAYNQVMLKIDPDKNGIDVHFSW
jgi:hypothetical protein